MPMPIAASRTNAVNDFKARATHVGIASADPGTTTVANEATGGSPAYARAALTWGSTTDNGTTSTATATATLNVPPSFDPNWVFVTNGAVATALVDKVDVTSATVALPGQSTVAITYTFTQS